MLYKKDEEGKLKLIIALYIDDVLISGREKDIKEFKETFKKTYKMTDIGRLKRHLGIWYEWIKNDKEVSYKNTHGQYDKKDCKRI